MSNEMSVGCATLQYIQISNQTGSDATGHPVKTAAIDATTHDVIELKKKTRPCAFTLVEPNRLK